MRGWARLRSSCGVPYVPVCPLLLWVFDYEFPVAGDKVKRFLCVKGMYATMYLAWVFVFCFLRWQHHGLYISAFLFFVDSLGLTYIASDAAEETRTKRDNVPRYHTHCVVRICCSETGTACSRGFICRGGEVGAAAPL